MKKSVSLSLSGIILATSLGMPYTQAKASTGTNDVSVEKNQNVQNRNIDSDRIARQSAKENGANLQRYDIEKQNRGKVTWTLKGLKSALSAKKAQINGAIKSAINKLPLSKSAKKKWIGVISVGSVAKLKLYAHLYKTIKANIVLTVKSFVSINYFSFFSINIT